MSGPEIGTVQTTPRIDKHLGIFEAINRIDSINQQLDDLLSRIKGEDFPVPCKGEDAPVPSLSDFLKGAPEVIDNKVEVANSTLSKLREELF